MPAVVPDLEVHFWAHVKRATPDECWEWQLSLMGKGYGQLVYKQKHYLTHRLAFFLTHGFWPKGILMHSCDNRSCCNPRHLCDATHQANNDDMIRKGRAWWQHA